MSLYNKELHDEMQFKLLKALNSNEDYNIEDYTKEFSDDNAYTTDFSFAKININFVNESNNQDPEFATSGASGFDLRANEDTILKAGEFKAISTGLYFELPDVYEIQIRPRSGLAVKHGVTVLNSPGTVDSDYRGEIKVILINHSKIDFNISKGDRIAQAIISYFLGKNAIELTKVDSISNNTDRNTNGFGSTGVK